MNLKDRVVVVTGGAGGIGAALGNRFVREGARTVVLADRDGARAAAAAQAIGPQARAVEVDAAHDGAVHEMVEEIEKRDGPIDLYCSNAGVGFGTGIEAPDAEWNEVWRVNVMSGVVAARVMVPRWVERGGGYLLITASAAGLLTSLGDAAYSATKHAAVGLAESIWIAHGDQGVKVSCLCPQGVRTNMTMGPQTEGQIGITQVRRLGLIEPEVVADFVVEGLGDERFLILPHPQALEYFRAKAENYGRWLGGMRKFQRTLRSQA